MKLFDITLQGGPDGAESLFTGGTADCRKDGLYISAGNTISFEKYFNLFPFREYAEYCGTEDFSLRLDAEGDYELRFYVQPKTGCARLIKSVSRNGKSDTPLSFTDQKAGGYAYFTFTAKSSCVIRGGSWEAGKQPERDIKIGVIICTYRREEFVTANLKRVSDAVASDPEWAERLHVFIVDNAKSLKLDKSPLYTVIPNRNLGGSGGFTRGMTEVCSRPEFTHFLLMDDDIQFDFGVLTRTWYLLSALTEKHKNACVGGAMLVLERPYIQYEYGGIFNGLNFRLINSGLDMRRTENLIKNQNAAKPDYNAWWYCCMPVFSVEKYGLPVPFFIKGDDVEYGMRAAEEWIRMSGIAVWHQDFASKYTGTLEYYIKRNLAVVSALRCNSGGFKAAVRFAYFMFKNLLLKNYACAEVLRKAYLDFKEGPDFFLREDSERVNEEIRGYAPPFKSAGEIEEICGGKPLLRKRSGGKRREFLRCAVLALENYLPAFMFSKRVAVTDAGNPSAADCFLKRVAVHYDEKSGRGIVCTLDTKRRKKLRRAALKTFFGLLFGYGKIRKKYIGREKEIYSRENWDRLFNGQ